MIAMAISVRDLFKNRYLDDLSLGSEALTMERIVATLLLSFIIGFFIFFVYKKTFKGILYSKSFNISLIMLTMITAHIIMPITSNIILSLGMVGALSIVRFRAAIKDPLDIVFMFWAISVGITVGAGFFLAGVVSSLIIGIVLVFITTIDLVGSLTYLLIVKCDEESIDSVYKKLDKSISKYKVKSQSLTGGLCELTIELRTKERRPSFMKGLGEEKGVKSVALVNYEGDYVS